MNIDQIEQLVKDRRTETAIRYIKVFLTKQKINQDSEGLFLALNWYRRLGQYRTAYLLIIKSLDIVQNERKYELQIWLARFLNLLGASGYTQAILNSINSITDPDLAYAAGEMYLIHNQFDEAYHYFKFAAESTNTKNESQFTIRQLCLADSLSGLKNYDRCFEIIGRLKSKNTSSLLYGVILTAEGEYLAQVADYKKAIQVLEESLNYIPKNDTGVDLIHAKKWLGYSYCASGAQELGLPLLQESLKLIKSLNTTPEANIDILRLLYEFKSVDQSSWAELYFYPGLSESFRNKLKIKFNDYEFGSKGEKSLFKYYYPSNELRSDGYKNIINANLSHRVLALIKLSHELGLPIFRAVQSLYPDEPYTIFKNEKKLLQAVSEVNTKLHFKITQDRQLLFLDKNNNFGFEVKASFDERPRIIVENVCAKITANEVMQFYDLSLSQAKRNISLWKKKAWI